MGLLNLTLPSVGQPNSTEDVDVVNAFSAIQTLVNGNLDDANVANTAFLQGVARGAFGAYRSAAFSPGTGAVIPFETEEFDVSGWHDTATSVGRYTPLVAAYYRFSWCVTAGAALPAADTFWIASLQKNSTIVKSGQMGYQRGTAAVNSTGSAVVQANGTTDNFNIVIQHNTGAGQPLTVGAAFTYWTGEIAGRS